MTNFGAARPQFDARPPRRPAAQVGVLERPPADLRYLRGVWRFVRSYRGLLAGAGVSLTVAAGATLAFGQALRVIIDRGFDAGAAAPLGAYFLGMLAVIAVLAAATWGRLALVSRLGERVVADIRVRVYDHVLALSPEFFETARTGEVLSRLTTDTTLIQSVIGSSASIALRNVLVFVGGAAMLIVTNPRLAALAFFVLPVVVGPILVVGRRVRRLSRATQDRVADAGAFADETLSAVATVQAFNHEDRDRAAFRTAVETAFGVAARLAGARGWLAALVILLVFGAVDLVLWLGARDVAAGASSTGELAAFVFYAVLTAGAAGALSETYGELQRAAGATERLLELLAARPAIAAPSRPALFPAPRGEIRFEEVTFHYPSRPKIPALAGVSLHMRPGETVALVGPSGAGKSTVFQLLLRFHDPQQGRVRIDGVTLRDADPAEARRRIGLVPQDAVVFGRSAAENIRYGRPEATMAEVRAAARAAQAEAFIDELPRGFDTGIGERGSQLSGGQRQRIAIARAILRDAPILLLDEATSSLDAESETAVQTALRSLMAGRTTLVIAHRLATVRKADRIVVLDRGRIVATGAHRDLEAAGGLYARLAALQFGMRGDVLPGDGSVCAVARRGRLSHKRVPRYPSFGRSPHEHRNTQGPGRSAAKHAGTRHASPRDRVLTTGTRWRLRVRSHAASADRGRPDRQGGGELRVLGHGREPDVHDAADGPRELQRRQLYPWVPVAGAGRRRRRCRHAVGDGMGAGRGHALDPSGEGIVRLCHLRSAGERSVGPRRGVPARQRQAGDDAGRRGSRNAHRG